METLNYTYVVKRLFVKDYFSGKKPTIVDYIEKYRIVLDIDDFVNWGIQFAFFAVSSVYKSMEDNKLHRYCLEKSAQVWCRESTENLMMIPELTTEFANILYEEIQLLNRHCIHGKALTNKTGFLKVRDAIEKWSSTGSGINSNEALPIINAIEDLINECIRTSAVENLINDCSASDELPRYTYNYSQPIITGVNQWSVFVRKYIDDKIDKVIEHKFNSEASAKSFSVNNYNLGFYF